MLSNGRLIILVTKDAEEARATGPSFSIAALLTNAQKSQPYSYQEACKAAAKIMIKTRRGERAKGLWTTLLYQITRWEVAGHEEPAEQKSNQCTHAGGYLAVEQARTLT